MICNWLISRCWFSSEWLKSKLWYNYLNFSQQSAKFSDRLLSLNEYWVEIIQGVNISSKNFILQKTEYYLRMRESSEFPQWKKLSFMDFISPWDNEQNFPKNMQTWVSNFSPDESSFTWLDLSEVDWKPWSKVQSKRRSIRWDHLARPGSRLIPHFLACFSSSVEQAPTDRLLPPSVSIRWPQVRITGNTMGMVDDGHWKLWKVRFFTMRPHTWGLWCLSAWKVADTAPW